MFYLGHSSSFEKYNLADSSQQLSLVYNVGNCGAAIDGTRSTRLLRLQFPINSVSEN